MTRGALSGRCLGDVQRQLVGQPPRGIPTAVPVVGDFAEITAWADGLKERAHVNVAAVAMANQMARIAWAVLTKGERYRPNAMNGLWSGGDITKGTGICERGGDGLTTDRRLVSLTGSMAPECR